MRFDVTLRLIVIVIAAILIVVIFFDIGGCSSVRGANARTFGAELRPTGLELRRRMGGASSSSGSGRGRGRLTRLIIRVEQIDRVNGAHRFAAGACHRSRSAATIPTGAVFAALWLLARGEFERTVAVQNQLAGIGQFGSCEAQRQSKRHEKRRQ